jgi:hypothetical protein
VDSFTEGCVLFCLRLLPGTRFGGSSTSADRLRDQVDAAVPLGDDSESGDLEVGQDVTREQVALWDNVDKPGVCLILDIFPDELDILQGHG